MESIAQLGERIGYTNCLTELMRKIREKKEDGYLINDEIVYEIIKDLNEKIK